MSIVRRVQRSPWLGAVVLTGMALSCRSQQDQATSGVPAGGARGNPCFCDTTPPTPAPPFGGRVDSVPRESLQVYIGMLHFVEDPEAGDRQALMVGSYPGAAHYGPIAHIQPERGNFLIPNHQLARGSIVSRIVNEGTEPYPKLGLLPKGTTYLWVEVDSVKGGGRAIFIEADSTGAIDSVRVGNPLETTEANMHAVFRPVQALARFIWTDDDEVAWSTCGSKCCKGG
jgi:hypothetical protein